MLEPNYYDRNGKPIKHSEWEWHTKHETYKGIREFETLANNERIKIFTTWVGIDYDGTKQKLYQTRVVNGRNDGLMRYYATELEAIMGHYDVVDIVIDTLYI